MLLVMDIGNTRIKWAKVGADGNLQEMQSCLNTEIVASVLKRALKGIKNVLIANVAGDVLAQQILDLIPQNAQVLFVSPQSQACGVINKYQPNLLGADRWAAIIAAWRMHKQPTIVVNAGTAITIDAIARDTASKCGVFIGGTIMPGLRLMQEALSENTALLKTPLEGKQGSFPTNTQDAMRTGCLNAIVGAINVMMQQLEKHSAYLPRLIISGGDANKIAEALKPHIKRVIIAENLVLQGLVLLSLESREKEVV